MAFLDVMITNLAVPDIAADFGVGITSLTWVVTLYTILFAALLAPAGGFADMLGRHRLFTLGAATFTLASFAAAVAPDYAVLLGARAVQGAGAALLIPASLAFVLADTPPARRPAAIGIWTASGALAAAIGPALGGVVVDLLDWRWLFCINVPIGIWLYVSGRRLKGVPGPARRPPDLLGGALLAVAAALLILGISQGQDWGWVDWRTIACFGVALVTGGWTLVRSRRHPRPALDSRLWSNRVYVGANLVSLLLGLGLFATLLLGVLYLVNVWEYSQLRAGLAMTPGAVASTVVGLAIGRSRRPVSARTLVLFGGVVFGATCTVMALWLPTEPHFLTVWLPGGLAMGVGIGAFSVGASSAAALAVEPAKFAAATGLNIAARQLGGAVGVAVLGLLFAQRTDAYWDVYWFAAAVSFAAVLAAFLLTPRKVAA